MENIFRIIGYGILFVADLLLYYFLHSHFTFMVMILMIAAPVASLTGGLIMRKYITAEVIKKDRASKYVRQNEEAFLAIKINNPTPFVALDVKVDIVVRNTFFKTEGNNTIVIPVHSFKGYELEIPVIPELPGIVSLNVKSIKIKDLMGFTFFRKKINASKDVVVIPKEIGKDIQNLPGLEAGMLESEESTKRGNDFSDVQEIREYIPGDKLMSIHWKLSAKRDILMVKDRVSMSDRQLVILPELCGSDRRLLEQIICTTYSLIISLIKDKTTVRLMYWSNLRYEYEDIRIEYAEDADDAFAGMFYEETYTGYDMAASYMASVHPEMKAFVHVTAENGRVSVNVREN